MAESFPISLLLLLFLASANAVFPDRHLAAVEKARGGILRAISWAEGLRRTVHNDLDDGSSDIDNDVVFRDCLKLYQDSEPLLARLVFSRHNCTLDDAVAWLSAALACHRSCLDGLEEKGLSDAAQPAQNLTLWLSEALSSVKKQQGAFKCDVSYDSGLPSLADTDEIWGLLASWDAANSKADVVVAQDGSGNHRNINDAVAAVGKMGYRRGRTVIYVKSGYYHENVEVGRNLENVMFVGDGIDKTVVSGSNNVQDGASTLSSATFGVSGNGFWARDMTFENTAGPEKHQAVALRVASDLSVFYRCSFKGYQDTLLVHSLRQFYRDCHIYGTVDFIFGDAAAVFQNCDIFVRKPMDHQSNLITAQGRDNPNQNTGISIVHCRVVPTSDLSPVVGSFKSYLGRPWKQYSRTVFLKTDLDGLVDTRGWSEWSGDFALSTLYYAEYMNTGYGASTGNRVKWPGFHVLNDYNEANQFSVKNFIQGDKWIPASGVPYWSDV